MFFFALSNQQITHFCRCKRYIGYLFMFVECVMCGIWGAPKEMKLENSQHFSGPNEKIGWEISIY